MSSPLSSPTGAGRATRRGYGPGLRDWVLGVDRASALNAVISTEDADIRVLRIGRNT